jgi:hypothetical protein
MDLAGETKMQALLDASGFRTGRYTVIDRLPDNPGERREVLGQLALRVEPLVFRLDSETLAGAL